MIRLAILQKGALMVALRRSNEVHLPPQGVNELESASKNV